MKLRKRFVLVAFALAAGSCVATPLPQPPTDYELDIGELSVDTSGQAFGIVGTEGAVKPGSIEIRVTPGPTDSDPVLEAGNAQVASDGSFSVIVVSPLPNIFFFEAIEQNDDVFFGAVTIDAAGVISEADPGPDADDDGSPDAIDCAPDDPQKRGQRCP